MAKIKIDKTQELENRLARALADYANLEKRFAKESSQVVQFANASLIQKLLEFKDNLERLRANSSDQGFSLVVDQFNKILEEEEVDEISTSGKFDATLMECVEVVPGKKDSVVEVLQKGYILNGRILRPAQVKVGNGQNN